MNCHTPSGKTEQVVIVDVFGSSHAELMARCVSGHSAYVLGNKAHSISPVAHQGVIATRGLGCRTVDNGDEIICDDDSVLAFLRGVLRDDALF